MEPFRRERNLRSYYYGDFDIWRRQTIFIDDRSLMYARAPTLVCLQPEIYTHTKGDRLFLTIKWPPTTKGVILSATANISHYRLSLFNI